LLVPVEFVTILLASVAAPLLLFEFSILPNIGLAV
jgi:hypothetical protein